METSQPEAGAKWDRVTERRKETLTGDDLFRTLDMRRAEKGIPLSRLEELGLMEKGADRETLEGDLKGYVEGTRGEVKGAVEPEEPARESVEPAVVETDAEAKPTSAIPGLREAAMSEVSSTPERKAPSIIVRATTLNQADCGDLEKKFFAPSVNRLRKALENARTRTGAGLVLPTDDEVLAVLFGQFNHAKIEALKRAEMQKPGLLATYATQTFGDTEGLINANKRRGQLDTYATDSRRTVFAEQDLEVAKSVQGKEVPLRFGFMELAPELRNRTGKLSDIVDGWMRDPLSGLWRTPTHNEYGQGQAQTQCGLDLAGWSMLSRTDKPGEMYTDDGLVSGGFGRDWDVGGRVRFLERAPDYVYVDARVRPVVMGEE